jgi:hypothetical protein
MPLGYRPLKPLPLIKEWPHLGAIRISEEAFLSERASGGGRHDGACRRVGHDARHVLQRQSVQ